MKIMRQNFESKNKNQILGLVYDLPTKLENSDKMIFPEDASAEWSHKKQLTPF